MNSKGSDIKPLPVKHMFKSLCDDHLDGETLDCVWIFLMVAVVPPQLRGEHAELSEGDVIVWVSDRTLSSTVQHLVDLRPQNN